MINVTRLNGPAFALNPDLIERIEATPDTVIHLVGGTNYVVVESVEDIVASVQHGANSYVRKPVDFTRFVEQVQRLQVYWLLVHESPDRN